MILRILASVINLLVVVLSVTLFFALSSWLFAGGIAAGVYNLVMLWKGMDYSAETTNVLGLFANLVAAVCGLAILIQGIALGEEQVRHEPLTLAIGGTFFLCGFVTLIVTARQSAGPTAPHPDE